MESIEVEHVDMMQANGDDDDVLSPLSRLDSIKEEAQPGLDSASSSSSITQIRKKQSLEDLQKQEYFTSSASFSSLENDSALQQLSRAFGSSVSSEGGHDDDKSLMEALDTLGRDALLDIQQALRETSSSSSVEEENVVPIENTNESHKEPPSKSFSSNESPPSDFFPMDDESISITDSFVLHSNGKKKTQQNDDDDSVDSTLMALRQQVEMLNGMLDDMHQNFDSQNNSEEQDGLQEEMKRLQDAECMLQQELSAIDAVLKLAADSVTEKIQQEMGDNGNSGPGAIDHGEAQAPDHAGNCTDGLPITTTNSFPTQDDIRQLQARMQHEQLQVRQTALLQEERRKEARDGTPINGLDIVDCRSCEEEVAEVATAGWQQLQKMTHDVSPPKTKYHVEPGPKISMRRREEDDSEIDTTPIKKNQSLDSKPRNSETESDPEQEKRQDDEDETDSYSIPKRIRLQISATSESFTTLGLRGVSDSDSVESNPSSAREAEEDDDQRIEELAARARVHTQASLLAVAAVARGLSNKSPPKRRMTNQWHSHPASSPVSQTPATSSPKTAFQATDASDSPNNMHHALLCATAWPQNAGCSPSSQSFRKSQRKTPKSFVVPEEHRHLYDSTDCLVDSASAMQEQEGISEWKHESVPALSTSPMPVIGHIHKALSFKNTAVQELGLPTELSCDEDIEHTMSKLLEEIKGTFALNTPFSGTGKSEIRENECYHGAMGFRINSSAFDETKEVINASVQKVKAVLLSTDNSEEPRDAKQSELGFLAERKYPYIHAPTLDRMKKTFTSSPIDNNPLNIFGATEQFRHNGSLNNIAKAKKNRLLYSRTKNVFHAYSQDVEAKHEHNSLCQDKEATVTWKVINEQQSDSSSSVDSMSITDQQSSGNDKLGLQSFYADSGSVQDNNSCPSTPSNHTEAKGVSMDSAPTNPFDELYETSAFCDVTPKCPTNPFDEPTEDRALKNSHLNAEQSLTKNPFDISIDRLIPENIVTSHSQYSRSPYDEPAKTDKLASKIHDFRHHSRNTMRTISSIAEHAHLNFELNFVDDIDPLSFTPVHSDEAADSDGSTKTKNCIPFALEILVNSPKSGPSDENRMQSQEIRAQLPVICQCPSDEGTKTKSAFSDAWKTSRKAITPQIEAVTSPISHLSSSQRNAGKSTKKEERKRHHFYPSFLPGHSVRKSGSPRKSPRQHKKSPKYFMLNHPSSPINALRSLTSIKEEKSESNDLSAEQKISFSAKCLETFEYSLHGVPTDERELQEEELSSESSISQVLSRIATRVSLSKDPEEVAVERQCENQDAELPAPGVDPIYDCMDCICGDESVNNLFTKTLHNQHNFRTKGGVPTMLYSGGNWEKRIIVGETIDTTTGDDSSQLSKTAQCRIGARQEGPNLGIELVYFDEKSDADDEMTSKSSHPAPVIKQLPTDEQEDSMTELGKSTRRVSKSSSDAEADTYGFSRDDTYGFPKEYRKSMPSIIPKSISFVEGWQTFDAVNETTIAKAVSYNDSCDHDRLLPDHAVQASLWMQIEQVRNQQQRDGQNSSPNLSTVVNMGTMRNTDEYCESMTTDSSDAIEEETTTTTVTTSKNARTNYDAIVETLLSNTQSLLDSIERFEYETYSKVTTGDITGFLEDGRFVQGRSFHCYYSSIACLDNHKTTRINTSKVARSYLDQVPIHQSVSRPTVRLVSTNVAIVSYVVKRKVLAKGKISETELAETRVWEKRMIDNGCGCKTETWLNCHFHISKGKPSSGDTSQVDSSTATSSHQQKSTSTSSAYYD